jgi:UDP-3-O-[3-hydroxymyristoyl] glucosamine N-acyltransferase
MKKITGQQIKESFPALVLDIIGDPSRSFSVISPIESIAPESLVFTLKERFFEEIKKSPATVVLAPAKFKELMKNLPAHQTWLLSSNPELAMAMAKAKFFQSTPYRAAYMGIHPSAHIDESAKIDASATICAGAVIGARVSVGAHCYVGPNAVIEADVEIGKHTTIHPLVAIGHSCIIGEHCEIMPSACVGSEGYGYAHDEMGNHIRIPHTGRVILHDRVHVGSNTAIDRGSLADTIIGEGTKIDNLCHLAHNTILGKNCLITAHFGAAGSCTVGDNFIAGGRASLGGHLSIVSNVQLAGNSGVTGNIEKSGQYGGYPLQPLKEFLKTKAAMLHLPEMRRQIRQLLKTDSDV